MSAPPRRRLSAEERRAAILDAALAVFSARGYHPSAIDDIAREAGISKALIYEHFDSKQGLYADLLERNAAELFQRLETAIGALEADSGAVRLATGLDAFFAFVEERRDAWRILFRDVADPETATVLDRVLEQVTGLVAALIAEDPGARAMTDEDADEAIRLLAQMLVGSVQSVANWWAEHREVPRAQIVEMVMAYSWLGLDRLSRGERWTGLG
jgi:AcrR family transcriptional regulator